MMKKGKEKREKDGKLTVVFKRRPQRGMTRKSGGEEVAGEDWGGGRRKRFLA